MRYLLLTLITIVILGITPNRLEAGEVSAVDVVAYTLWCEDRTSYAAMVMVANVIRNRVFSDGYPNSVLGVIHKPMQFSCWGADGRTPVNLVAGDYNMYQKARVIARKLISNTLPYLTRATHYYAHKKVTPYWSNGRYAIITDTTKHHTFLVMR